MTDPRINLALEEFVVRNFSDAEYLLLYTNTPTVVLGKHQNALEEANLAFANERGIPVIRRISGGGTVYHDTGNLNFSIITKHDKKKHNNYQPFLSPIITTLREWGVESRLNNRNSLVLADGRKFSGNAQFTSRDRMMSHGTLLFNSDLDALNTVLQPKVDTVESKAVQSVRSRVANLCEVLPEGTTLEGFCERIRFGFIGENARARCLTEAEWAQVHTLASEKYSSWEWNIGRSPQFVVEHKVRWNNRQRLLRLRVVNGVIAEAFLDDSTNDDSLRALLGKRYDPTNVKELTPAIHAATDNAKG